MVSADDEKKTYLSIESSSIFSDLLRQSTVKLNIPTSSPRDSHIAGFFTLLFASCVYSLKSRIISNLLTSHKLTTEFYLLAKMQSLSQFNVL